MTPWTEHFNFAGVSFSTADDYFGWNLSVRWGRFAFGIGWN